eukprot:GHRR01018885.1.p1 GENE.GHRR01018885.1~~GHRR01018885.1.p1  ORF type:complete len:222 (+),score=104.10 GHRR01018885.1:124-789(+)
MSGLLRTVTSAADFNTALKACSKVVVFFWASWSAPCQHMKQVLETLAKHNADLLFIEVEAEEVDDVTEQFSVTTVPYFVLLQSGRRVDELEGADAAALTAKVKQLAATAAGAPPAAAAPAAAAEPQDVNSRIKQMLASSPVVVFMKGSAASPYCGFSRKVVDALKDSGVSKFTDVDILKDEELRQAVKKYSSWPTFPQLYVAGPSSSTSSSTSSTTRWPIS